MIYGMPLRVFAALALEVRIRLAASDYLGWSYGSPNRFPAARPGLPSQLVAPDAVTGVIDCSSFGAYVVITATPAGRWDAARYAELQIFDAKQPWSPIDAIERAGVGTRVDDLPLDEWGISQGWVDARLDDGDGVEGGHFRVVKRLSPTTLRVLESTSRDGIGPRWSNTTIDDLRKKYPAGVKFAQIRR